jgi:hypothetical protein
MSRERLPEGVYKGFVRKWGIEEYDQHGSKRFFLEFSIDTFFGDDADNDGTKLERKITRSVTRYFSVKSINILVQDLKTFGYDAKIKGFAPLSPNHKDSFNFAGKEAFLSLSYQEYKDRLNEKWDIYRTRRSGGKKVADDDWARTADDLDAVLAASEGDDTGE